MTAPAPTAFTLRSPTSADGAAIHELVKATRLLEPNTCYAYLLLASHFAETCVVATQEDRLLGVVVAYRPPTDPHALFVWQVGVHPDAQGQGLARSLLHAVLDRPACHDVRWLTATVAPSNVASDRLFRRFARDRGVDVRLEPGFVSSDFGAANHEDEPLYRIGPLVRTS